MAKFDSYIKSLGVAPRPLKYYDLSAIATPEIYDKMPYCIRVFLESTVRNCDNFQILESDVQKIIDWETNQHLSIEVPFSRSCSVVRMKNYGDVSLFEGHLLIVALLVLMEKFNL